MPSINIHTDYASIFQVCKSSNNLCFFLITVLHIWHCEMLKKTRTLVEQLFLAPKTIFLVESGLASQHPPYCSGVNRNRKAKRMQIHENDYYRLHIGKTGEILEDICDFI